MRKNWSGWQKGKLYIYSRSMVFLALALPLGYFSDSCYLNVNDRSVQQDLIFVKPETVHRILTGYKQMLLFGLSKQQY